mmetsp:Transcript_1198/g.2928  ORF Transcript_1198/g.2928 Transcript_1198/m.2928 type:complete len:383 (+) Transcript_1198:329-1477(+)
MLQGAGHKWRHPRFSVLSSMKLHEHLERLRGPDDTRHGHARLQLSKRPRPSRGQKGEVPLLIRGIGSKPTGILRVSLGQRQGLPQQPPVVPRTVVQRHPVAQRSHQPGLGRLPVRKRRGARQPGHDQVQHRPQPLVQDGFLPAQADEEANHHHGRVPGGVPAVEVDGGVRLRGRRAFAGVGVRAVDHALLRDGDGLALAGGGGEPEHALDEVLGDGEALGLLACRDCEAPRQGPLKKPDEQPFDCCFICLCRVPQLPLDFPDFLHGATFEVMHGPVSGLACHRTIGRRALRTLHLRRRRLARREIRALSPGAGLVRQASDPEQPGAQGHRALHVAGLGPEAPVGLLGRAGDRLPRGVEPGDPTIHLRLRALGSVDMKLGSIH